MRQATEVGLHAPKAAPSGTAPLSQGHRRAPAAAAWLVAALALLAGCATQTAYRGHHGGHFAAPGRYYPPPGPPGDPWGPYVREAAARFAIPERWIREVMRQESGGQADAVSSAGAMGLMQVIPDTYEDMREQFGLGDDPFDPHNNILAGAAYIKEMYDRYGSPGFLAAYNAGPNRLDLYLSGSQSLPNETVNYLASVAPRLGNAPPMSGPLAAYAMAAGQAPAGRQAAPPGGAAACDPDMAYDPSRPCQPAPAAAAAPVVVAYAAPHVSAAACDPDSAYDPQSPCRPAASRSALYLAEAPPPPPRSVFAMQSAAAAELPPRPAAGAWAIQVGAFVNPGLARAVADSARDAAPDLLRAAPVALPTTAPLGGAVLYRARLTALSADTAVSACARLTQLQVPCLVVPPGQQAD
jgi:hypothetical protein